MPSAGVICVEHLHAQPQGKISSVPFSYNPAGSYCLQSGNAWNSLTDLETRRMLLWQNNTPQTAGREKIYTRFAK
jgi:hypothetical protein